MFVDYLNGYMDKRNLEYFTASYQNQQLFKTFVKS